MPPSLSDLQRLLYRLITAANGVEEGLTAEKNLPPGSINGLIRGGARFSATERVGIYANMYFYRLLDAIKEDFPATSKVLGEVKFHNLITAYLVARPPSHPSITEASRHLAEFAGNSPLLGAYPFVADLVRLERALVDVFLGPDAEPLGFDDLRAIHSREWPSLRIDVHPAIQILNCEWRVDEVLRAVERAQSVETPIREPTSILVWRRNCDVNYRALDGTEQRALELMGRGNGFGAVCEAIAAQTGESTAPATINQILSRWLADGVLVGA
jgi:hypothetical protein